VLNRKASDEGESLRPEDQKEKKHKKLKSKDFKKGFSPFNERNYIKNKGQRP